MFDKQISKVSICFALLVMLSAAVSLFAVDVKKKEIADFETFQKGQVTGTILDSRGGLAIGPRIEHMTGPEVEYYLGLDIAGNGDIYIGGGHKASVYRVKANAPTTPKGQGLEEIFTSDDLDVYALLVRNNGDVYIGTSPDGRIYKVSKNKAKEQEVFFNPEEKFIWDMKEDRTGNIFVAVGNSGGVYRVSTDGNAHKVFTSEDTHIISLYVTRGGSVLAGSGDRGLLYRIDNNKVKVLFDSPFQEIRGICEDKDGNIFFSATRDLKHHTVPTAIPTSPAVLKRNEKEEKQKKPKAKSTLYCRRADGVVEEIWSSPDEYIYSVCYDDRDNSVLIGTGNSGRIYRVRKDTGFSILYESEAAQVFKMAPTSGGFAVITNNTATLSTIRHTSADKGVYLSEVFDLGIQSKLGKIYWEADTPGGTNISLSVRTGNSNVPDGTWSKWSAPYTDSNDSRIDAPGIRYFQVRAVLNTANASASPRLNSFTVYYLQSNLKPQMKKVEVKKMTPPVKRKPDGTVIEASNSQKARLLLRWQAFDPNHDKLKYNLYLKKVTDKKWIRLKKNITVPQVLLNTELYEDGKYRLRVVAEDSLSNPPSMAGSDTLESAPFLIDATPPLLDGFSIQGRKASFSVKDQTSVVAAVTYSYNGKTWYPVFPVDKIADSRTENYSFTLAKSEVDLGYVFVKVTDEFKNARVYQKEL